MGIGASAGGLDAFRQLLAALPADTGMAYVLVQHLHPKHESILAELLSKATRMTVAEVTGDVRVEPNRVYVIPPTEDIVLSEGALKLVPRSRTGGFHMPIDAFLRTLAEGQGSQAIGVILSGMASDGTLGLTAIKAEGGIAFAQDPGSARFGDMPRSAIAAGCVDFVLTPEEIARELARLGRHPYVIAGRPGPARPSIPVATEEDDAALATILSLLQRATGADFSAYKKATLQRRIARRMAVNRMETLDDYARRLEGDAGEAEALYQDCLISVTSFFRDSDVFQALSDTLLPMLLEGRTSDAPLRVWVPGCATGEEAYSIAICLLERAARRPGSPPFQIFATDLSESALKKARAGIYLENIAQNVSAERLRRFFARVDGHYQISKTIRETCVFAQHDLTRDPPFSRIDLISCRNLLIYLESRLQERVFASFHYALNPSGCLLLGPAEGVGASSALFSTVDERHKIFKRKATAVPPHFHFAPGASAAGRTAAPVVLTPKAAVRSDVPREADRMLLARYSPPGVVVDEALNIIEFRGDTDPFLEHAHGQASLNLIQMARRGFLMELRQAIAEARLRGAPSRKDGLQMRYRGRLHRVSVEAIPLKGRAATENCLLILFETHRESARTASAPLPAPDVGAAAESREAKIAQLEQKLAETSQYLHTVLREHDTALEELQSTNEEALSSNEELQSVNEELQTAQQEIQSANEELATLNQELQDRNTQLGHLNDDLLNLLGSVNIPIVMVGKDLHLRRFTPAAETLFSLMASDIGRPLGDVRTYLEVPDLEREVRSVIENVRVSEREVQDRDGRFYVMRIWPYRAREDTIDGAVVVLMDVDALRRGAEEVQHALDRATAIVATVREPLLILDGELKVEQANRAFHETFQVGPAEIRGLALQELGGGEWNRPELLAALSEALATDTAFEDFEVEHEFPALGRRTMVLNARRLAREPGGTDRLLLAIEDRTEIKRAQEGREALLTLEHSARERAETADHLKDQFVATVSHELRGPLTAIVGWAHILSEAGPSLDEATLAKGLATITRSVTAQDRLIADLLDHSRVVTGNLQLARRPLALFAVAEAAIESVRAAAEAKDIELDLSGDRAASVILGDPDRMQQVLWNLFFNAVKFTPRHGRVQIWMGRVGTQVHLTVSDTGQGIRKDFLPHVFERFRQQAGATDPGHAGLGLGLTLVRELVELHGGTVRAESPGPGEGATFTLVFPIPALMLQAPGGEARVVSEREPMAARTPPSGLDPMLLDGVSVLVVDDEADVREALTGLLERHGARVRTAAAAADALEAIREKVPDVLVSDIAMPGEDGYELMRRLRQLPAEGGGQVPALAVSAFARDEDRRKAVSAGFQLHLAKPVPPVQLVAHVARLAGRAAGQ
ncbi:MAG TPA: chemotaxis protein CheB [Vicinamibacteria bacterium]|nr:chemotaxis protein CheB [Vicinamibacteria bacterium]